MSSTASSLIKFQWISVLASIAFVPSVDAFAANVASVSSAGDSDFGKPLPPGKEVKTWDEKKDELEKKQVDLLARQAELLKELQALEAEAPELARAEANSDTLLSNPTAPQGLLNVQLQKQYVPVIKEGKTVAYKTSYYGSVNVGSLKPDDVEPQGFTVVMDTGSGHLILPAKSCVSETCEKHRRYNRERSTDAVDIEADGKVFNGGERDQVSIAFGTGEVLGEFVEDTVCPGLAQTGCVRMRVVLATEMTPDPFGLFSFDGVLGLGLNQLTLDPHFSFFSQFMKQYPSMSPQFAVFLARHDGGDSVISFGGHDPSRASSDIVWSPVTMPDMGYWQVAIKSIKIDDVVIDDCQDGSCRAILDTGTSLLGVPRDMTKTLHRHLARPVPEDFSDNTEDIDCRTVPGKQIHFDLGDMVVSLDMEDYSRPIPFNMTIPNTDGAWRLFCRSLLLPVDLEEAQGPKVFIWGEPVLRRYYTVYDVAEKRIGISRATDYSEDVKGLPSVDTPPLGSLISGSPMRPSSYQSV